MSALQAMASMVTMAPLRAPPAAKRSRRSGMALVSVDFSSTASCPSTSRAEVAKADTRWSGPWPMLRLWLRRAVLPSMAIRSGRSGQTSRTQALKQAENRPGSIRFISSEPACPRHPVMVGQEAAQELQALLPPGCDRLVVVAVGDRAADHQQQNLRQRMGDPPRLAGVLDDGQMVQKGAKAGLLSKHGGKAHDGAPESSTPPNHGPRKP